MVVVAEATVEEAMVETGEVAAMVVETDAVVVEATAIEVRDTRTSSKPKISG